MICATEHKSAALLTPTDAAVSLWYLQNTKVHMELFASPIYKKDIYFLYMFNMFWWNSCLILGNLRGIEKNAR